MKDIGETKNDKQVLQENIKVLRDYVQGNLDYLDELYSRKILSEEDTRQLSTIISLWKTLLNRMNDETNYQGDQGLVTIDMFTSLQQKTMLMKGYVQELAAK